MKAGLRVLVVDDESAIRKLLRASLEPEGFEVHEARNGADALRDAAVLRPDIVLLDLGLPDMTGLQVLQKLRQWSHAAVLVLTVQDQEEDKVALLDAGADDYLTKPFGVPELLARLRVLGRHRKDEGESPVLKVGPLELDFAARQVRLRGQELKLTKIEYEFLRVLARHAGKVVTQRQILKEVWGPEAVEHNHYLRIYAAQLRKKIEDVPAEPKLILTEPGVGYRLKSGG
jgi:two-component system KDP operon response regulator KdpE